MDIQDDSLEPYFLRSNPHGGLDIYKRIVSQKRDENKKLTNETYERTKLVGSGKDILECVHTVVKKKIDDKKGMSVYMVVYVKELTKLLNQVNSAFHPEYQIINKMVARIDKLEARIEQLEGYIENIESK